MGDTSFRLGHVEDSDSRLIVVDKKVSICIRVTVTNFYLSKNTIFYMNSPNSTNEITYDNCYRY